ncbi:hypothetical protein ACQP2P_44155 [Dactylosporangium sp. CA-139114]|uniref:hypothetical protein n=1 Tax=Dactylosporangium sp. CA-139114 TaxID=3239931 RepID=UPI003D96C7BA
MRHPDRGYGCDAAATTRWDSRRTMGSGPRRSGPLATVDHDPGHHVHGHTRVLRPPARRAWTNRYDVTRSSLARRRFAVLGVVLEVLEQEPAVPGHQCQQRPPGQHTEHTPGSQLAGVSHLRPLIVQWPEQSAADFVDR